MAPCSHKKTSNGDVYGVASKTILSKSKPCGPNRRRQGTNAQLWEWEAMHELGRAHSGHGIVVKLPNKEGWFSPRSRAPAKTQGFPNPNTTPDLRRQLLPAPSTNVVSGGSIAGHVAPGTNLKARAQLGMQVTYGF